MSADRIAADLEARIRSGDLPPGACLPTHRDLAREHGAALNIATRAMRLLAHRGLVTGEVGRGSYVRAPGHADGAVLRIKARPPGVIDLGGNVMPLPGLAERFERAATPCCAAGGTRWPTTSRTPDSPRTGRRAPPGLRGRGTCQTTRAASWSARDRSRQPLPPWRRSGPGMPARPPRR